MNPTTAAEWASYCGRVGANYPLSIHDHVKTPRLCVSCADAYVRQQVEAAAQHLEHLAQTAPLRSGQSMIYRQCAAAIRARSVDG